MSRIANSPITLPSGVEVKVDGQQVDIKGAKGALSHALHELVGIEQGENELKITLLAQSKRANALAGTSRALLQNMVTGVWEGFEKKLLITGIGYRAQVQGKTLNLTLGFSHPVSVEVPEEINVETPSQTEIVVKGVDKQKVGQLAANIRAYRKPEPYKGRGIRYADEIIVRKEAKKT